MSTASWWTDPNSKSDTPVVAHTPDETKYHYPDERQNGLMRGGIGGVVVPRANVDGTSKGFNANRAGVVHVDPDAPDGGSVVDLTNLDQRTLHGAYSQANYPHEVYYSLGAGRPVAPQQQPQRPPQVVHRTNDLVPQGSYVVPEARDDGTQNPQGSPIVEPIPPQPSQPVHPQQQVAPAPQPQPQPQPQPVAPHPVEYQQVPPQPQPQPQPQPVVQQPYVPAPVLSQQQMGELAAMVAGQLQPYIAPAPPPVPPVATQPEAPPPATRPSPPKPWEGDEGEYQPTQTLAQIEAATEEPDPKSGVIVGFESLQIPYVTGPLPLKPRQEVFFEIPGHGTLGAKYHDIVNAEECLVLVFDTRYEDGYRFLPADKGEDTFYVTIPAQNVRIPCNFFNLHYAHGVFDHVVLVKAGPPETLKEEFD